MVKDEEQSDKKAREIPEMLEKLRSAPDFYAEMKWEFTSWSMWVESIRGHMTNSCFFSTVPFLSRVCPSDTYKIWKKGTQVRVDTTLIGFDNMQWLRGDQSFMFNVTGLS